MIFITIMVRNFILLARRKIYVTPESILNGVQYSATQIMYNATSGHAVIYVGLYAEASAISMVVHGVTLFDCVCNYKSPVSSVAF